MTGIRALREIQSVVMWNDIKDPTNLNLLHLTKNGILKEVEISLSHIEYKGKKITQGIILDITNKKNVEERLKESEKKFRTLFQNHSAVKLIVDPLTGNILEANKAAVKFYGWPVYELQKMNLSQINRLSPKNLWKS
jgi:PAS domain-containing protein